MVQNVEWRIKDGADVMIAVDAIDVKVGSVAVPDSAVLKDYLAVTGSYDAWAKWSGWQPVDSGDTDPNAWGQLIISRAEDGQVSFVDPELYWEGIRRWFRAHGESVG